MGNLDFIYKRKSVRDYSEGEIPREDIMKMLEAATMAPSPKHQQNWHFVVVENKETITKMADVVRKSHEKIAGLAKSEEERAEFMKVLPYYLNFERSSYSIIVYAKEYDMIEEKILRENGVSEDIIDVIKSPQSGAQGIGAAIENFLLAAANMGYAACYMTGPAHAKTELEEAIGFTKEGYSLMAIISLGLEPEKMPRQPRRRPIEDVVTFI